MDSNKKTTSTTRYPVLKFIYEIAAANSYELLINKKPLQDFKNPHTSYFIHNPYTPVPLKAIKELLTYYKKRKKWKKVFNLHKAQIKLSYKKITRDKKDAV